MNPVSFVDVHVRYGERVALGGVSACLEPGVVIGVVGPNGAGKTTLLKVAAGLISLGAGSCVVFDRAVSAWPREVLARRVAYLPQGGEAAWPLPAWEIAALGRMPHGATLGRVKAEDAAAIEKALTRADALEFAARQVDALSAGERSRVLFARALATEADVLLADEPAAHLDPAHQLRLMELLQEEARRGAAVAVTLHELALAARCDRLIVLHEGRVAAEGAPVGALSDDVLAHVFGITALRAAGDGAHVPIPWSRL